MTVEHGPFSEYPAEPLTPDEKPSLLHSDSSVAPLSQPGHIHVRPVKEKRGFWTRKRTICALLGLVVVVVVAAVVPAVLLTRKRNGGAVGGGGDGRTPGSAPNPASPTGANTGGDGTTIILSNGTTFTYHNAFGGFWVADPNDPYTYRAQPNSWTPPLNATWTWGKDRINGVNIGGWLVLEPFITPDIFQRYPSARDEYTLSELMAADEANGGLGQLERHYDTFITEQDIAEIASAGLNWIRVPLPFWALETWPGEPFLPKVAWKYFLRLLDWARKYGIRVCLDFHAVPGSQNGYNHSGKLAPVGFMNGNMGLANAQRTLYYLRVITEFISQPEYVNLVPMFGIVNEALVGIIGIDQITSFYLEAHDLIRSITGKGAGMGPFISIHDGFQPLSLWSGFLPGSDRIALDQHPYFGFGGPQPDPIGVPGSDGQPGGPWPKRACDVWGGGMNQTRTTFGVTYAGEFSASPNDCGFFLRGVNSSSDTPGCDVYNDWQNYNASMKAGILNFVEATFDALGDWFFWTWKIAPSITNGQIGTPTWSYQLGLREGWIPADPRSAAGKCASLGSTPVLFDDTFEPWQIGSQTSTIPANFSSVFSFPPATFSGASVPLSLMPTYTNTGPILTLPVQTYTSAPASATSSVDGWANKQDVAGGATPVQGCPYPSQYDGIFRVLPTAPCTGPAGGARAVVPEPTPPPGLDYIMFE